MEDHPMIFKRKIYDKLLEWKKCLVEHQQLCWKEPDE